MELSQTNLPSAAAVAAAENSSFHIIIDASVTNWDKGHAAQPERAAK